jgi:prepilin-type N-terminal cleavage/methylation domain-containing protein
MTMRRKAFTLIELLVVIAIFGVLVAFLVTGVQKVREAANRIKCVNNLKQMGLALHGYNDAYGSFPPGIVADTPDLLNARHSGLVFLLPYLEQEPLHNQYNLNLAWKDADNLPVAGARVPVFLCPSSLNQVPDDGSLPGAPTDYAFSKGATAYLSTAGTLRPGSGLFDVNSKRRIADILDGTSQTFAMGEAVGGPNITAWNV